ncbi:hypothetical protein AMS68_007982 [Peltaster fructicola]|uniref:Uncharacterized protein n=1 Tax=Peltaster fructicola TaxID=286661 RepID=A0A6H0Y6D8_9PEZI|nr:hypothetical protein AMS68_007982 [Peltaster fructicola]
MAQQPLPSKEATLFRHLVQNYESKQYKKGLKVAEQILKKHPKHGDTQAMKALILSSTGKQDEAFELCKLALQNAMKSHVCWHVYGLLYRGVRNYEEAIKAYKFALRIDSDNAQIQRDLALLQMQMRDYAGLIQSRQTMMTAKPQLRQNWTALAIAYHLSGDLKQAESILTTFEGTLKDYKPSKSDLEHQEAALYKTSIIAEQGDVERALENLDSIQKTLVDRTAAIELKGEYLLAAGKTEAEKVYRTLLDRNPERRAYYDGLEKALALDRKSDHEKLIALYKEYADKSERRDAPRRIPLDFLSGAEFETHADAYLRRMFGKGVPSTFANLKQLYSDKSKQTTIVNIVEKLSNEEPQANGGAETNGTNGTKNADRWGLSVNYFLAQHYDYHLTRDLDKAEQYIEKAISLNPSKTDYTYHMTRARIQKHRGNPEAASASMNAAREMDLKDRYINTKCAKYQLRNNQNSDAVDTMGLFTRKEAVGGPFGDLLDMQCVWFITEDGESYLRQGKLALALKRFQAVYNIFDTWTEDQFDFHTFSLRKGMVRSYVEMLRWEDKLREHPFFTRAALSAIKICLLLHDRPEIGKSGRLNDEESAADKKKAAKKARKDAEKAEADRKAAAAKKPVPKADDAEEKKKEDKDPLGVEAFKAVAEKPLEEAMKYLTPLLELSPKNIDAQVAGFDVYIRRGESNLLSRSTANDSGKYLPALKCLLAAQKLDQAHPALKEQDAKLRSVLSSPPQPLDPKVKEVIDGLYPLKV